MSGLPKPIVKEQVVGFLFDDSGTKLRLMLKDHPAWQAGKLNGCGGKREDGESEWQAMRREGMEEMGVDVQWSLYCVLDGDGWKMHCFRAFDSTAHANAKSLTSELVLDVTPDDFERDAKMFARVEHVDWLVSMARERSVVCAGVKVD